MPVVSLRGLHSAWPSSLSEVGLRGGERLRGTRMSSATRAGVFTPSPPAGASFGSRPLIQTEHAEVRLVHQHRMMQRWCLDRLGERDRMVKGGGEMSEVKPISTELLKGAEMYMERSRMFGDIGVLTLQDLENDPSQPPESPQSPLSPQSPSSTPLSLNPNTPRVWVLDASWLELPNLGMRNASSEFGVIHIPGAHYFNIDVLSDVSSPYPHMLPTSREVVMRWVSENLRDPTGRVADPLTDEFLVYDSLGVISSPRVWWTLKVFGFDKVFLLDGGLPKWYCEGRPTQCGDQLVYQSGVNVEFVESEQVKMNAVEQSIKTNLVMTYEQMVPVSLATPKHLKVNTSLPLVIDARAAPRFQGTAPEPRPGIASGHIPNSVNLPFTELMVRHNYTRPLSSVKTLPSAPPLEMTEESAMPVPTSPTCPAGDASEVSEMEKGPSVRLFYWRYKNRDELEEQFKQVVGREWNNVRKEKAGESDRRETHLMALSPPQFHLPIFHSPVFVSPTFL
eukprot:GHVN01083468.1.p1 GENE.GHVN01083468.1~~GHVN01083468.1.p1  ORF type:complete len:507 (+),score=131.22 GHVN01083468.1:546-2066(+)